MRLLCGSWMPYNTIELWPKVRWPSDNLSTTKSVSARGNQLENVINVYSRKQAARIQKDSLTRPGTVGVSLWRFTELFSPLLSHTLCPKMQKLFQRKNSLSSCDSRLSKIQKRRRRAIDPSIGYYIYTEYATGFKGAENVQMANSSRDSVSNPITDRTSVCSDLPCPLKTRYHN